MAAPAPIRKVETTYETTRPRDAAILQRQSANDNYAKPANDNQIAGMRPTVADEFNATYAKAGIQSQSQFDQPIRKVETEKFADVESEGETVEDNFYTSNVTTAYRSTANDRGQKVLKPAYDAVAKVTGHAEDKLQRLKITRVNGIMMWPSLTFWFFFQLPLGILNLIAFGFSAYLMDLIGVSPNGGFFDRLTGGLFVTLLSAVDQILGIKINPADLYYITAGAVFILGLAVIILISIVYTLSSVRFLLGSGAVLKIPTFLFAIFFLLWPFLNIFPWHLLWMAAVYRYPK